jgi:dimethylamine/trimethylamine dehydrogenase
MARDPKYDVLFEPIRIGPKTMKNRFYQTPHCTGLGTDYPYSQAALRRVKAEGGWAVVNSEYCSIHPESDDRPWIGARIWDEDDVRNLSFMCAQIHEHGALSGIELYYGGALGTNYESRLVPRGPSQIASEAFAWHSCVGIDKAEIRELQQMYVDAARRARAAGADIVNVYGGEVGAVTQHFLMRFFNKRTDEYGGTLENRARFWLETIELVREAVGDDCAITARLCLDSLDGTSEGMSVEEEGVGFVELADHLVDFWDFHVGGWGSAKWGEDAGPSSFFGEDFQGEWVQKVRPYTDKPVVGVGRFTNPDTMARLVNSRALDIIGAARPSIADPFLPAKIEQGRLDEIRECIGCNMCVARFNQGVRIVCTQNATMGEEYRRGWHPEKFSRATNHENDVLVVGAGPAGLECAMILAKRGMRRVHLVDAAPEMGGALKWIAQLPRLGEWGRVIDYRSIQLEKLGVEFIGGTSLSSADVKEYGAEIVIVATGAAWATNGLSPWTHAPIPGADAGLPAVSTPDQLLAGDAQLGERVTIYDCEGYFMGASLAEKYAQLGKQVTLITPLSGVAPYRFFTGEGHFGLTALESLDVTVMPGQELIEISREGVTLRLVSDHDSTGFVPGDSCVLVTQRESRDQLYRDLASDSSGLKEAGIVGLYRIGDCVSPRFISECVFDGHRLAREIDAPDPATPLPYLRERLVVAAEGAHS